MKTLTICGSMRFSEEMKQIAWELETLHGYNILQCIYGDGQISNISLERLRKAHNKKIDLSDGIYVVDMDGYLGESVLAEIHYAISRGKEVLYHSTFTEVKTSG